MRTIEQVREGMKVLDAGGDEAGTVEEVVLGQADTVDVEPIASGPGAVLGFFARSVGGRQPDVPEEQAERLRKVGYIKVDSAHLLGGSFYAPADSIADVAGDQVTLTFSSKEMEK
jgi:hypothetical protein